MANANDEDAQPLVLDPRDYAIVAHPVLPELAESLATQSLTDCANG